ncbi:MAG: FkbM family methyltransferase [Limimaricola sp.]|uniref:FkbM family methyltransferase n=1 Tax=Limimaricola sp. TaxID=2211665 RepID=UPI001DFF6B36|nr:FkbM family methyltransferase [Limimaricola sp.]MBI1417884.1 FkbM family methyltransferase [Limimaricola sp.]
MNQSKRRIVDAIVPQGQQLAMRYFWRRLNGKLDKEMFFVKSVIRSRRRFLDIGANIGVYTYYFSRYFSDVNSFEPISEITSRISALDRRNVTVHNVALSNAKGVLDFFIPIDKGALVTGLASLEPREPPFEIRRIEVHTIDSYKFTDVDLIKIDVEGHEYHVIEGALETIGRNKPILIVEIEQRHTSMDIGVIFGLILDQGYIGFFLTDRVLTPLSQFSYAIHQEPFLNNVASASYMNNFIFLPISEFG